VLDAVREGMREETMKKLEMRSILIVGGFWSFIGGCIAWIWGATLLHSLGAAILALGLVTLSFIMEVEA